MDTKTVATIGAILERDFDKFAGDIDGKEIESEIEYDIIVDGVKKHFKLTPIGKGMIDSTDPLQGTTLKTMPTPKRKTLKCLAFRDEEGNIYFHFRGTGDGFWGYNASAAYSANESTVQKESLKFYEEMIESLEKQGISIGNVYVTGHSQGGNTAQYVTVASKYSDYIKMCVSLDGPGFSKALIEKIKRQYGEAYYERQRQKLFAYNGCSDYVSPLGEIHIIPETEEHTKYIETEKRDDKNPLETNHCANYLLHGNELNREGTSSEFREAIIKLAERLAEFAPEDQEKIGIVFMKFLENYKPYDRPANIHEDIYYPKAGIVTKFTEDDLQIIQNQLLDFVMVILSEHPDQIDIICRELKLGAETTKLLNEFIREFNDMPEKERKDVLRLLTSCLKVKNGELVPDGDWASIVALVVALLPTIQKTALNNPEELMKVLEEAKVFDKLKEAAMKNPGITINAIWKSARHFDIILGIGLGVEGAAVLVEKFYDFIEKIDNLTDRIKTFVVNCVNAMRKTYTDVYTYLRNVSAGAGYVEQYPYIKVDTGRLREYANRINDVNRRLRNLDGDLNSLYLQVGFLDIWDILVANLITGLSPRLVLVKNYLQDTASDLEAADNNALTYLGG